MPAFSSAFGPIVEPGWPSGALGAKPDYAGRFLQGAALGASVNARTQQLENQLMLYSIRAQKYENDRSHQEDMFNLLKQKTEDQNDLQEQRLQAMRDNQYAIAERANAELRLQQDREKRLAEASTAALTRKNEQEAAMAQMAQIQTDVTNEGYQPGTEAYKKEVMSRAGSFIGKLPPSVYKQAMNALGTNFNAVWNQKRQAVLDEARGIENEIKNNVWGDSITGDVRPLYHPDQFPAATKTGPADLFHWRGTTVPDPGNIFLPAKDATGAIYQRPVATSYLTDLRKRLDANRKALQDLGTGIYNPSTGVYPDHTESPIEKANRLLNDPDTSDQDKDAIRQYLKQQASTP